MDDRSRCCHKRVCHMMQRRSFVLTLPAYSFGDAHWDVVIELAKEQARDLVIFIKQVADVGIPTLNIYDF